MKKLVVSAFVFLVPLLLIALASPAYADVGQPVVGTHSVPGGPLNVAVGASGEVWATLPAQNAVVLLDSADNTTVYTPTHAASEPYDIAYAGGDVWVSERTGNRIARLNPGTGQWAEFDLPTSGAQPTGLAVLAGTPTQVWFAEQNAAAIGQLTITSTTSYQFVEYPLPTSVATGHPQDVVVVQSGSNIDLWFTLPDLSRIARFRQTLWPSTSAFYFVRTTSTGIPTSTPWNITYINGYPWFTDPAVNGVGKYYPGTISAIDWYSVFGMSNTPYGLNAANGFLWFAGSDAGQVGRIDQGALETAQPESLPAGAVDASTRCIWIAESEHDALASWCPPYEQPWKYSGMLPLVQQQR